MGTPGDLVALANHLMHRRDALMTEWHQAVKRDPDLNQGEALPRAELFDHIPALLKAFEEQLRHFGEPVTPAAIEPASAHGLQRWQQGYDLREVIRELGQLNRCVIIELDRFADAQKELATKSMPQAREIWTALSSAAIEESVIQYFELQRQEAVGHVEDLDRALAQIRELEQQRGELWQEAAHDLRGNLGVVAHVAVGLSRHGQRDDSREDFVRILNRNVASLHHLLNDVTSLARLQAGRETRKIDGIDVTTILKPLCEDIRPLAEQRGLYLKCTGPDGFAVDGDAVKIRRIAQNLILNSVKYTRAGGVTVHWGDSEARDFKRWCLTIADTGPGFHTASGQPITSVLDPAHEPSSHANSLSAQAPNTPSHGEAGEGVGLSIVKRLCEMLDASVEVRSIRDQGTTFQILFPRHYGS